MTLLITQLTLKINLVSDMKKF